MVYRTLWSAYKHWTTVKLLGAIYPTPGGFCAKTADPTAYAGSAGDVPCTLASPIMKLLEKQMASLADKGFTLHAQFAEKQHYLVIPMYAYNKQKSFTMEDASMSHTIGHLRVQNFPQASEVEPARFDWENVLCLCAAHQLTLMASSPTQAARSRGRSEHRPRRSPPRRKRPSGEGGEREGRSATEKIGGLLIPPCSIKLSIR
jgi:hypothetical protein